MSTTKLTLLLTELEAEVLEEALDLYVRARPTPVDTRFEYRYRAARSLLDSLRHRAYNLGLDLPGDDDDTSGRNPGRPEPQSRREQLED